MSRYTDKDKRAYRRASLDIIKAVKRPPLRLSQAVKARTALQQLLQQDHPGLRVISQFGEMGASGIVNEMDIKSSPKKIILKIPREGISLGGLAHELGHAYNWTTKKWQPVDKVAKSMVRYMAKGGFNLSRMQEHVGMAGYVLTDADASRLGIKVLKKSGLPRSAVRQARKGAVYVALAGLGDRGYRKTATKIIQGLRLSTAVKKLGAGRVGRLGHLLRIVGK